MHKKGHPAGPSHAPSSSMRPFPRCSPRSAIATSVSTDWLTRIWPRTLWHLENDGHPTRCAALDGTAPRYGVRRSAPSLGAGTSPRPACATLFGQSLVDGLRTARTRAAAGAGAPSRTSPSPAAGGRALWRQAMKCYHAAPAQSGGLPGPRRRAGRPLGARRGLVGAGPAIGRRTLVQATPQMPRFTVASGKSIR